MILFDFLLKNLNTKMPVATTSFQEEAAQKSLFSTLLQDFLQESFSPKALYTPKFETTNVSNSNFLLHTKSQFPFVLKHLYYGNGEEKRHLSSLRQIDQKSSSYNFVQASIKKAKFAPLQKSISSSLDIFPLQNSAKQKIDLLSPIKIKKKKKNYLPPTQFSLQEVAVKHNISFKELHHQEVKNISTKALIKKLPLLAHTPLKSKKVIPTLTKLSLNKTFFLSKKDPGVAKVLSNPTHSLKRDLKSNTPKIPENRVDKGQEDSKNMPPYILAAQINGIYSVHSKEHKEVIRIEDSKVGKREKSFHYESVQKNFTKQVVDDKRARELQLSGEAKIEEQKDKKSVAKKSGEFLEDFSRQQELHKKSEMQEKLQDPLVYNKKKEEQPRFLGDQVFSKRGVEAPMQHPIQPQRTLAHKKHLGVQINTLHPIQPQERLAHKRHLGVQANTPHRMQLQPENKKLKGFTMEEKRPSLQERESQEHILSFLQENSALSSAPLSNNQNNQDSFKQSGSGDTFLQSHESDLIDVGEQFEIPRRQTLTLKLPDTTVNINWHHNHLYMHFTSSMALPLHPNIEEFITNVMQEGGYERYKVVFKDKQKRVTITSQESEKTSSQENSSINVKV